MTPCDEASKSKAAPARITFGAQDALLSTPHILPMHRLLIYCNTFIIPDFALYSQTAPFKFIWTN